MFKEAKFNPTQNPQTRPESGNIQQVEIAKHEMGQHNIQGG